MVSRFAELCLVLFLKASSHSELNFHQFLSDLANPTRAFPNNFVNLLAPFLCNRRDQIRFLMDLVDSTDILGLRSI